MPVALRALVVLGLAALLPGCKVLRSDAALYETIRAEPRHDTEKARELNAKAVEYLSTADYPQAHAVLQEALIADVDYAPAHNNLGHVYLRQGKYYLAAWEFEYAAKLMPNSPVPRNNLGLVMEAAGRTGEAIAAYEEALARDPGHPQFLGNLARVKVRAGERSPETAALLKEVVLRDNRPAWREWAEEQLATTHLAFENAIGPPSLVGPAPDAGTPANTLLPDAAPGPDLPPLPAPAPAAEAPPPGRAALEPFPEPDPASGPLPDDR